MNIVILYGRLVEEPALSSKENGSDTTFWVPFRLAVSRGRKKEGKAEADFIPCIVFGRSASYLARWGRKGGRVMVIGRIHNDKVDNPDGSRSFYTEIVVASLEVIDYKQDGTGADRFPAYDPSSDPGRFFRAAQHDPGIFMT